MMYGICTMLMFIFIVCTSSHMWTMPPDILLTINAHEKCRHPIVCHINNSVNNGLTVTILLVSAEKQFAANTVSVTPVHGDMGALASLSSCQGQFNPSSYLDDLNVSLCSVDCPTLLSNHVIHMRSMLKVTSTKQSYFDALIRLDSMDVLMRGITSILNHVKWKTCVVISSSYLVLTALSGGRLASNKLLLYMIDDPNNPLESIDLVGIYQLLLEEDLRFLVICPSNCIQNLLIQARWLESNMSLHSSFRASQWLMVPSTGSVMDMVHSFEPVKTDGVVFLEYMPCTKYFSQLNLKIIMKTLSRYQGIIRQSAQIQLVYVFLQTATKSESSLLAKLQVLRPSHGWKDVETVGSIGRDHSLEVKHQLYYGSEYGFQNRTLIVGTLEWPPFVIRRVENGSVKFDGLCIQLLQELAKQLNFSYNLVEPEDREWSRILNGSWTGLVKLLVGGNVDMVVAPFTMTHSRAAVVDFTVPYFYSNLALILGRQDPNTNKWLTLLYLFRYEVLVCILVSLIVSTVILFVMEEVKPVRLQTDDRPSDMRRTRYSDIFFYHFGALMANGGAYAPSSGSGRTVFACWWIFAVILASTYRGNLVALLADRREAPPFSSLAEMVQQDTYKWGFVGGSSLVTLFQESNMSVYHKVWNGVEEMMGKEPDWLSMDGDEHMRRAVERQYVFMGEEATLEMWDDPRRCDLQIVQDNFFFNKHAVGLPKHSTYTQRISKQILRIYESGLLDLWWDRWKPKHQCPAPNRKAKRVDMLTLLGAFYGAGVGVAMALLVLVCEIFHKRRCETKPTT
ncbi:glutamate receptor ionotropic, kainate 3-like [Haliotis asinina]|uniref:glutamate receptor ionotropic, kainate 3-like n=1 Tax=Haliotis asinina TaxID=109174 RepID=UPI003531DF14